MSILVTGMGMPNNCTECPLNHDAECAVKNCMVTDDCYVRRASWCPIIHVPPHGRLIDADALVKKQPIPELGAPRWLIEQAPTIIPAEEGE